MTLPLEFFKLCFTVEAKNIILSDMILNIQNKILDNYIVNERKEAKGKFSTLPSNWLSDDTHKL